MVKPPLYVESESVDHIEVIGRIVVSRDGDRDRKDVK